MYSTRGVGAVATVTELRSKTSAIIDRAKSTQTAVMIQRNNEPEAVLVSHDLYLRLVRAAAAPGR